MCYKFFIDISCVIVVKFSLFFIKMMVVWYFVNSAKGMPSQSLKL